MTLKLKSAIISFGSIICIVVVTGIIIYTNIITEFQLIENQRVEQNIRRLKFILKDKVDQIDVKLSDWSVWDDTYNFINKPTQQYIVSNFSQEAFKKLGVDEVLFINLKGGLVWRYTVLEQGHEDNLYSQFATGSALFDFEKNNIPNKGLLSLNNHIIIFSIQDIAKSDGTGPVNGKMVFAKHFDSREINSVKELTQFNTTFMQWGKNGIEKELVVGKKNLIRKLNNKLIAGYYVLEDVYSKPIGILRADIVRDITLQGKAGMVTLMIILISTGLVVSFLNYGLMNGAVLKQILSISSELKDIGDTNTTKKRLVLPRGNDEIAVLRKDINTMLDDIESSQMKLDSEVVKRESLVELINSIVVMLDPSAHITMINKRGSDLLGYTKDELIGKDWIEIFVIPEEKEMIRRRFRELMEAQTIENSYIENSILTKDGKRLVYGWHNTIIKNAQGIVTATLSLGNDITQDKEEDKQKEEYTETLKRMNEVMIGRELKMIELKKRITELEKRS